MLLTSVQTGLFFVLLFVCAVTDAWKRKIYNVVTFPAMAVGIILNFSLWHIEGITDSIIGIVVGFLVFLPLFMIRVMGAGDLKLLMAIGAFVGWMHVLETAMLGTVIGAIFGVVFMVAQKQLWSGLKRIWASFISIVYPPLTPQLPPVEECVMAPFGVALSMAAAAIYMGWFRFDFLISG